MHFLIGLLIVCFILAVPALRNVAFVLLGVAVVGGLILILAANSSNTDRTPAPMTPDQIARAEQARKAAAEAEARSRQLIDAQDLELRQVWLTSYGSRVQQVASSISDPGVEVVVKNNSQKYTLTELALSIDLMDCPAGAKAWNGCEQVGTYHAQPKADVPPGQVRQMSFRTPEYSQIEHLPPLRGQLSLRYSIGWVRASEPTTAAAKP